MNKKIQRVFICLVALLAASRAMATTYLVLEYKDHTLVSFGMEQQPKIVFQDGKLVVTATSGDTKETTMEQIARYFFSDKPLGIDHAERNTQRPVSAEGHVRYQGLQPKAVVSVFALNGQQVARYTADTQGCLDIDLNSLPRAVYILRAGNNSIKVMNK